MFPTLDAALEADAATRPDLVALIRELAEAAVLIADRLAEVSGDDLGEATEAINGGGDVQKALDVLADHVFRDAAKAAGVAFFGSEEEDEAAVLNAGGDLALAVDPLDGSSNIDTNVSVGTIFSVLPVLDAHRADPKSAFLQAGCHQLAGGFFVYGPQLLLVANFGGATQVFGFSPSEEEWLALPVRLALPAEAKEFAVNASNFRHWDERFRAYYGDLLAGQDGPRGRNFNMRWVASMVADAYRILLRGGVYLYPGDARKGYAQGRLRLIYEANPVALCVEGAGGAATDGLRRILDIVPGDLHQRTPLVFGSSDEVEAVSKALGSASSAPGATTLASA
ncbi:class 1 fructose-bisphosphatase [Aurantimonas sp. MSK8Z-1]|uniref:class 1 fructose-bisphosphatase n=1 Tax=Mangrovibrevibacter kandeliae TaxID=2968473 RepID=UPI002119A1E0|nr:class 1 fructose-bisphosphatase [Aurantimonas sp. MSK8Z-1]MCW4115512.1 class 1 fructose-bisphosphatase [Aurantimonas sp. MSK8Z-1]